MKEVELGFNINSTSDQELLDGYSQWQSEKCTFESLTYGEFFKKHLVSNLPCVIKNIIPDWECTKKWIKDNTIHYKYFIENYGDLEAPVADCNNISYNAHCKCNMKVSDYMKYLRESEKSRLLYLKDWHLKKLRPSDKFYEIPKLFASDWLNEYAQDNEQDDFMFVYIGPKKSWTPLHVDVYTSYSWSVNIIGKKKWILFPPGEEAKLKDSLDNLPMTFKPENTKDIKYFELVQEQGDGIFVPSGWYHQVVNEEDTISINHNWVNACNIKIVWNSLAKTLLSVQNEIIEFKDTPEYPTQCQLILKSLFGMDCEAFIKFVCYIGQKRISLLHNNSKHFFENFCLGQKHIKFDLKNILNVLNLINRHPIYQNQNTLSSIKCDFMNLKNAIINVLE